MESATRELIASSHGNREVESNRSLFDSMYHDFHRLARSYLREERDTRKMSPTSLVHEAYIRMADQSHLGHRGKTHFFAIGARIMRQLLVDSARYRNAQKRGGDWHRVKLDESLTFDLKQDSQVLELDELLRKLEQLDPRQAKIIELRFFGGMSMKEIACALDTDVRSLDKEWLMARAWLRAELASGAEA